MAVVSRAQWGAAPPKRPLQGWPAGKPDSKTAHYLAQDIALEGKTIEDFKAIWRATQHFHLTTRTEDYSDIAYNDGVDPLGNWYEGRGGNFRSGAQGTAGNTSSRAVCYMGGPNTPFTLEAQRTFSFIGSLIPGSWKGHFQWNSTACPGNNIKWWLFLIAIGGGAHTPAPQPVPAPTPVPHMPLPDQKALAYWSLLNFISQDQRKVLLRFWKGVTDVRYSEDVRWVQVALNLTAGTNLVVDGKFGLHTLGAILAAQKFFRAFDPSVIVDGIVGSQTRKLLSDALKQKYA